ncbi:MAG: hypothetical protein V4708_16925 [Bacteroidota bacterium]
MTVVTKGRPPKEIDWDLVDELLEAGCSGPEIAPHFNIHPETLYDRVADKHGMLYSHYSDIMFAKGDSVLRAVQHTKAKQGDNTMLVWLGKNRLKQKETPNEITVSKDTLDHFSTAMAQMRELQESYKKSEESV